MVVEATSDVTIHPTGPQDQVKKKPYKHENATRHRAAAMLPGAAVPTMANMNMQNVCAAPPHSKMVRRPKKWSEGNMQMMPANWQTCEMMLMTKAFLMPETA